MPPKHDNDTIAPALTLSLLPPTPKHNTEQGEHDDDDERL